MDSKQHPLKVWRTSQKGWLWRPFQRLGTEKCCLELQSWCCPHTTDSFTLLEQIHVHCSGSVTGSSFSPGKCKTKACLSCSGWWLEEGGGHGGGGVLSSFARRPPWGRSGPWTWSSAPCRAAGSTSRCCTGSPRGPGPGGWRSGSLRGFPVLGPWASPVLVECVGAVWCTPPPEMCWNEPRCWGPPRCWDPLRGRPARWKCSATDWTWQWWSGWEGRGSGTLRGCYGCCPPPGRGQRFWGCAGWTPSALGNGG